MDPRTVTAPRAEIRCPRGHRIGVADNNFFYFGSDPIPLTASDSFDTWCRRCGRRLDPMWHVKIPELKKLLNEREAAGARRPVKIKIAEVSQPRPF
ncbi:hypothetical protein N865_19955 [Intrasporangium oryzae NRRL B-24470]|uniref:Uncharacterized protein n=1 Tax=Intrasporangium oryzae NRRL B-24470 TaxID=1386089 RepID=W9G7N5_9MICO|nr:hypothetical protein [Intrasporangium oryzae]EWS99883.1 hypothetical protein N865_19955 [Intrasporangium oryzae NRRL B-24470]